MTKKTQRIKTGKLYAIISLGIASCYIGSTFDRMSQRKANHECSFRKNRSTTTAKQIIAQDDHEYEVIMEFDDIDKKTLLEYERNVIKYLSGSGATVVNKNCDKSLDKSKYNKERYVYGEEEKQKKKEYYEKNKEKIKQQAKERYAKNKSQVIAQ